jgi:hypothetical protein
MMLVVPCDGLGNIEAACEWHLVDRLGQRDPKGQYIYVDDMQMSSGVSGVIAIRKIRRMIAQAAPNAVGAYWERWAKNGNDKLHAFKRSQLVKEVRV